MHLGDPPHGGGPGHNRHASQWQTPHLGEGEHAHEAPHSHEHDFDLVEKAFAEGFASASDPTSFLRLSGVPFEATRADGTVVKLLRVEHEQSVDMASLSPHLGGTKFRYDPLPAQMVSRRNALRLIYFDGSATLPLTLEEARNLVPG